MRLARILFKDKPHWGIENDGVVVLVSEQANHLSELLQYGLDNLEKTNESVHADEAIFLSPVTSPCNIFCQGKNYSDHRIETGATSEKPNFNQIFTKADSSLTGTNTKINRPPMVKLLDYEIELGLVIGKNIGATSIINEENWSEYIAGLVITNDISARDIQLLQGQWYKGKSFRGFCPVGPYIVPFTKSNFNRFFELRLQLFVNDELRQDATTSELLFKPHETLSELSQIVDIKPGDLLLTGTPGGVALQVPSAFVQKIGTLLFSEPQRLSIFVKKQLANSKYLKDGDSITASIRSSDGSIDLGTQKIIISSTVS